MIIRKKNDKNYAQQELDKFIDIVNRSRENGEIEAVPRRLSYKVSKSSQFYIPPTISKEAQEILQDLIMNAPTFVIPGPEDLGWQKLNQEASSMVIQMSQPIVDSYQPRITAIKLGDINVLEIKPKDWRDNGKVLIYLHGGGYTLLDANSTVIFAATVANTTGLRVISVDYSLAPSSKWNQTTSEVIQVIRALKD